MKPALPAAAQTAPQPTAYGEPIQLEVAQVIITAALEAARAADFRMAFAVVEPSGELVAFARMDDVQYASVTLAQDKARSAARFRQATAVQEERLMNGRTVMLALTGAVPVGGGVPIVVDGHVIGAIGVSGASAGQDHEIAEAGIAALR